MKARNKFSVLASLGEEDSVKDLIHRPAEWTRVRDCISPRMPTGVVADLSVTARNPPQREFRGSEVIQSRPEYFDKGRNIYAIEQWLIECGYQTQVDDLKKEAADERRSSIYAEIPPLVTEIKFKAEGVLPENPRNVTMDMDVSGEDKSEGILGDKE
ncbi:hypothetical protein U1Q18_014468 [Sarracenia purpurea var. burkii]